MRRLLLLLFTSLSLSVSGQKSPDKKLIDSLKTKLWQVNAELKYVRERGERVEYLLAAKEMALRSEEFKDSTFQILLAVQAHNFWKAHKGAYADTDIYRSLYHALETFNDPLIQTLPRKIDRLNNKEYVMTSLMAEKLCSRIKRNMLVEEWDWFASDLPYEVKCPSPRQESKK